MRIKQLMVLVWAVFLLQCASSPSDPGASGKSCSSETDCGANGLCVDNQCAKSCTTDADCADRYGLVCGVAFDGSQKCVEPCVAVHDPSSDDTTDLIAARYACVDGVTTSCVLLDGTQCEACGCGTNERCTPGVGCGPKLAVGKECTEDFDCKSDNCSSLTGTCRVPVGQPCDASNCDYCQASADGSFQYCSRTCSGDYACNGGACVGSGNLFTCHLKCGSASDNGCPARCDFVTGNNDYPEYFCGAGYGVEHAPQAIGTECRYNTDCTSNLCHTISDSCPDPTFGCSSIGFCSAACTASKDCPKGYTCADTLDPELRCIPTCTTDSDCAMGACANVTSAEGKTISACPLKNKPGDYCRENRDCGSNECKKDVCAPDGPQPNGSTCGSASDCQSMICKSSECHGSALLGDACTSSYDCGIGDCCTDGASKNTCAQNCD